MRDNIRSLVGEREKRAGSGPRKDFYMESEYARTRLEFRWSDRVRIAVSYGYLIKVEYHPQWGEEEGLEAIYLDAPAHHRMEIIGSNLEPIVDLIMEERLQWVREAFSDEKPEEGKIYIRNLGVADLYDWKLDVETIAERREAYWADRQQREADAAAGHSGDQGESSLK